MMLSAVKHLSPELSDLNFFGPWSFYKPWSGCNKILTCGHQCGGVAQEETCLPCLRGCSRNNFSVKQSADDICLICHTDQLHASPSIQLKCGHIFHLQCCRNVLEKRWIGPRISFTFAQCPICKVDMDHPALQSHLQPVRALYEEVRRKAMTRLEYENLVTTTAIITPGSSFFQNPAGFAMNRYAYYVCFKCNKPYFGGEAGCVEQAATSIDYNPAELVCAGCCEISRAQSCQEHGSDFIEYKCRYCCSVAVFFCFGTTHFCNICHTNNTRLTSMCKDNLPRCPAGPNATQLPGTQCPLNVHHPPTGDEFALGCGICHNARTF